MRRQFPAAGLEALPIVDITVNGRPARALLDTGCSRTVLATWVSGAVERGEQEIVSVDGSRVTCVGTATVALEVCGKVARADCVVVKPALQRSRRCVGYGCVDTDGRSHYR